MAYCREKLESFLNTQYEKFNAQEYLQSYPDPLIVAHKYRDFEAFDELALICALYAYGNAKLIVKNLLSMPFNLLLDSKYLQSCDVDTFPYYRFQTRQDTQICFLVMLHLIKNGGVKNIFLESYLKHDNVLDGIRKIQDIAMDYVRSNNLSSNGINFLFGDSKNRQAPLKRYNMFLRWMVRSDNLDFGLWSEVKKNTLLLPLDTHTFKISKQLGLCTIKSYSLKAVLEITKNLKEFDSVDPIKYDFALYRIGQLNLLDKFYNE